MKKTLLSLLACAAGLGAVAGVALTTGSSFERAAMPGNLAYDTTPDKAAPAIGEKPATTPAYVPQYRNKWEGTDTIPYFVIAQSCTTGYSYTYGGGDILTYEIGVCRNGNKVTFTGLGNTFDANNNWSPTYEYPISGNYDEATGTITVDVPVTGAGRNGTYLYDFRAGTFDRDGVLQEAKTLTFKTDGDLETITAQQDFGIAYTYGWGYRHHAYTAYKKTEGSAAVLVPLADGLEFGQTYPGSPVTATWRVINRGGSDAEFVMTIDADGDVFSCSEMSGVIEAYSEKTFTFTFNPESVGEFEGLVTLQTDDDNLLLQLGGEGIAVPDYSAIVKNGDFTFTTTVEYPFEITEVDHPIYDEEGNDTGTTEHLTVAGSTTNGRAGMSSIKAKFTVPGGKLGRLSFKGHVVNTVGMPNWYKIYSYVLVDDDDVYKTFTNYTGDIPEEFNHYNFTPGEHYLYILHDNRNFTDAADGTYIWDLDLQLEDCEEHAAVLNTPVLNMGNALLDEGISTAKEAYLLLTNEGSYDLEVIKVSSDNAEVTVDRPTKKAGLLEEIRVPVVLEASTPGEKHATITIETNAGTFTATVNATVYMRPDYSQIVTGGLEYLDFEYNEEYPFLVENGVAYNCTSKILDNEVTNSHFTINYTIPQGKIGIFSWDGHAWGLPAAEYYVVADGDHAILEGHNSNGNSFSSGCWDNDVDYGSAGLEANEIMANQLTATPGTGYFKFGYYQAGDKRYFGEDRYEVSNFNLRLIDSKDNAAELLTPEVEFEPVYVGPQRYSTATIKLRNLGTNDLNINDIPATEPFYGIVPTNNFGNKFNQVVEVTLWFYPSEEGKFEDDLVIKTTAGDFTVHCKGETKDTTGILYPGDFEDAAYGWVLYDYDGDGECWNLGTNLWGTRPTYVHSGIECLGSISSSNDLGNIQPDNWTVSPGFNIPEEGALLSYFISSFSPTDYEEHYSFYITDDYSNLQSFLDIEPVLEETIEEPATQEEAGGFVGGWMLREFDLTPWAGKTIWVAFRHHDCLGQYLIRLDDMFIYDINSGIGDITAGNADHGILRQEIYDAEGRRLSELQNGINMVKTVYTDGTSRTSKLLIRK